MPRRTPKEFGTAAERRQALDRLVDAIELLWQELDQAEGLTRQLQAQQSHEALPPDDAAQLPRLRQWTSDLQRRLGELQRDYAELRLHSQRDGPG
jgi:hypothetical protein